MTLELLIVAALSTGLGESTPAPAIAAGLHAGRFEQRVVFDTSDKVSAGWNFRTASIIRHGLLVAGVDTSVRSGPGWQKRTVWTRVGIGTPNAEVVWRWQAWTSHTDDTMSVLARAGAGKRWRAVAEGGWHRYRQQGPVQHGWSLDLMVGRRWQ